jgi:aspartyl-tRNA(Asn)/glutamyl-tRNA(Gln) amidotransferase subunit C
MMLLLALPLLVGSLWYATPRALYTPHPEALGATVPRPGTVLVRSEGCTYSYSYGTRRNHMPLTADEVRHIARLARLGLSPEEVERFRDQLSTILDHFQGLNAFDTDGVPPTAQSFDLTNVERDDRARPSAARAEVLANAPRTEGAYVRVRAVLD